MSDKEKNLTRDAYLRLRSNLVKGTVMKMGDREIVDMPSVYLPVHSA